MGTILVEFFLLRLRKSPFSIKMKLMVLFAALCAVAVAVPFDSAAYLATGPEEPMGLVDELSTLGFTKLVELIEMAGLKETLNTGGPFTIFAPSNEAIMELLPTYVINNMTALVNILKAHVTEGRVMSTAITDNLIAPSLMQGVPIRINMIIEWQLTHLCANGAPITMFDRMAKNGIIHGMSRIILPYPTANMITLMGETPGLSMTLEFIKMAGLQKTLEGEGPFTLFAPDNRAWMKIGANITMLRKNMTLLADVLTYHVVPGAYYASILRPGTLLTTVQGMTVLYNPDIKMGTMKMNEADVHLADQSVTNGVIWVMHEVIVPTPSMMS